ncbi:MAG: arylsulfatase [Opitutaceae bacterium]|nr:arylsulfatase [Opitutaceae bacterium]
MKKPAAHPISRSAARGFQRRDFLRTLGLAAATFPQLLRAADRPRRPPNIVLIMADDLGFSDLGCYGSEIRTPHLDALAARGVRFSQFYNCAVCCPTRGSIMTGLYPHQSGMGWMVQHNSDTRPPGPYQGYLNDRCLTLAEALKGAGYRTFMSGKWHLGENRPHWPVDRGFDRSFGLLSGLNYYGYLDKEWVPGLVRHMFQDDRPYFPKTPGFYLSDAIADHAVEFLEGTPVDGDPFFLYLPVYAPHYPLHAPEEAIAKYRGRYRQGWDAVRRERYARLRASGIIGDESPLSPRDPGVPAWTEVEDPDLMDLKMAIYAAQIEIMDAGIGRVFEQLRKSGREEDTQIFFLSDNGGCEGDLSGVRPKELNSAPYLGGPESYDGYGRGWANVSGTPYRKFKTMMQEGGIATPMIAAGPCVRGQPGRLCRDVGHVMDFMPTCLEIAGAPYPAQFKGRELPPLEGASLMKSLRGESNPRVRPIYWEFEGRRAMRDGPWKLIGADNAAWELYDLSQDRSELHDLARQQPERVREMSTRYAAWADRCGIRPWAEVAPRMKNVLPVKV